MMKGNRGFIRSVGRSISEVDRMLNALVNNSDGAADIIKDTEVLS